MSETVGVGAWQLLWLPPSLSYYRLEGAFAQPALKDFTKRLVFSCWRVVPKVVATLLSYEAERNMVCSFEEHPDYTPEARDRRRGLLRFARTDGRLTGMPVLGMLYPSVVLADRCDPLTYLQHVGAGRDAPTVTEVLGWARSQIEMLLRELHLTDVQSGPEDESWYWAAPILLDLQLAPERARSWWSIRDLAERWAGENGSPNDDTSAWSEHVARALEIAKGQMNLGRQPADLSLVLSELALAGPAICALRALARVAGAATSHLDTELQIAAAQVGWGFRSLFNSPDVTALVRGLEFDSFLTEEHSEPRGSPGSLFRGKDSDRPYWRRAVDYCVVGSLQSVLDEYAHTLRESLGLIGCMRAETVTQVAESIREAVILRVAAPTVDHIEVTPKRKDISVNPVRVRGHFALRFGDDRTDDGQDVTRADQVRRAFNSPFWPFVLATTSVGQEGLDFHTYCHVVVHWNLPSNPVDLEQREGRVHRYKGHAVRKNVARRYHELAATPGTTDPWEMMFCAAASDRDPWTCDLVPFWIYQVPGGATIERRIPALPLSRDRARAAALRRSLAVYRLVFGQARQEDLVAYLLANLDASELPQAVSDLTINLEPPRYGTDCNK
jgi:hypothetical protein